MERPLLSVVFATKNRLNYLKQSVRSLRRELDGKHVYEIVAVVGASKDGSVDYLKSHGTVRIVHEDVPRGCCYAFDLGLRAARGDWVCWLNDDVEITPAAFDKMLTFMTDPTNAQVGMGAFPNSRSSKELHEFVIRGVWDHPAIYADFGFIRRRLLEELGYLDLSFHKYGWDPDLSLRVWERGLYVAPCEGANIVHFFADDALRKTGDVHLPIDSCYLDAKWEGKRREGCFYRIYEDESYRVRIMRLLTGWPKIYLRLHYASQDGLLEDAEALYRCDTREAAPRYYKFGLELIKHHCFAEAHEVFSNLAQDATQGDPMLVWYQYKCGEALKRIGKNREAHELFRRTAASGHVMSRLNLVEDTSPLKVVIGRGPSDGEQQRIKVPLNIQDPKEWDYYFALRPMDDALLPLSGNEFGLDSRMLARMCAKHLAQGGRLTIMPRDDEASARRQAELLAAELCEIGFTLTADGDGALVASRLEVAAQTM